MYVYCKLVQDKERGYEHKTSNFQHSKGILYLCKLFSILSINLFPTRFRLLFFIKTNFDALLKFSIIYLNHLHLKIFSTGLLQGAIKFLGCFASLIVYFLRKKSYHLLIIYLYYDLSPFNKYGFIYFFTQSCWKILEGMLKAQQQKQQ